MDSKQNKPLVIAGPCSAETRNQVLNIAQSLQEIPEVQVFRAGIWKPRTRPGGFEGAGEEGLSWLQEVKQTTRLQVATEVATPQHVAMAVAYNIDVLWIGARTTVNPFLMDSLAEALHGTEKMIYIKNPVNPDLALWIGGVERFMNQNITNLGVIHRGFSNYDKTQFRNQPEWQIAIDFKNQFPLLPMIVDPSHIAGNRVGLKAIAQKAMHLGYNGLMIETHDQPDEAWSDAQQQITPNTLKLLIDSLEYRFSEVLQPNFQSQLTNFRGQIDELDLKIVDLLGKRMAIATEIGRLKKANQATILQNKRWVQLLQTMTEQGRSKGLSEYFMLNLFKAIHQESISHQENV